MEKMKEAKDEGRKEGRKEGRTGCTSRSSGSDVVNDERVGREAKEVKEMKEEGRKEGRTGCKSRFSSDVMMMKG